MSNSRAQDAGRVSLVGAGPGDPELLTLKAVRRLQSADVVLYDALTHPDMLEHCRDDCRRIYVGKRAGGHGWKQTDITTLLVNMATRGQRVVRLKGGDPYVFGRGGEEAMALAEAGVVAEVVPGVTSAVCAAGAAGIPVTHRGVSTGFTVVTGYSASDTEALEMRWYHLARAGGTLVFLMPTRNLSRIVATLRRAGMEASTPCAMIRCGTHEDQTVVESTLEEIEADLERIGNVTPATFVVGDVVALRQKITLARAPRELSAMSA